MIGLEGDTAIGDVQMYVSCKREQRAKVRALVDARGHFLIKNLSPGTYEVTARLDLQAQPNRPTPPQKQVVNVTNGSESEVNYRTSISDPARKRP